MEPQIQIALEKQNPWWFNKPYETGIPRLSYYPLLQKYLNTPEILLILGARRTGKSTLLYQLISSLKVSPEAILFVNLDEPLFQSKADDPAFLSTLIEEYLLQHKDIQKDYIFIDEVQNYKYWVQTIKTFQEYLEFSDIPNPSLLQKRHAVNTYLQFGGFPRVVLEKDELLKQDILKNYFQTIYLKDIIFPHKVRSNKDVFDLLYFVISNMGAPFSYTNIGKMLNISPDTVKEYLSYAEQSYLLYITTKYDPSVRKQLANPRKIYGVDTGLVNSVSFKFSENRGRLIENLVFMTLVRNQKEVFYHKETNECDFVIREGRKIVQAIQVTLSLQDESVKKRELKGLLEALNSYKLSEGTIVTETEKDSFELEGKKVNVIPLYEWLELV